MTPQVTPETELFVRSAIEELTDKFVELLDKRAASDREQIKEHEARLKALEKDKDRRDGSKAALLWLAAIGGSILGQVLVYLVRSLLHTN